MKKLIHNLRQKPESFRRTVALVTSFSVTGLIAIVWVSGLVAVGISPQANPNTEKALSPFALMFNQAKELIQNTGNQLASVSEVFNPETDAHNRKPTVATSTYGVIGISTTNYDTDNNKVDSLTEEQ